MSLKDRLAEKAKGIDVSSKDKNVSPPSSTASTPKTSPGQMLMVSALMKESNKEIETLKSRLTEFEDALPVRLIESHKIVASKWVNRISQSFESSDFLKLRDEIAQAKGNVQPIKVRPLKEEPDRYEIVFGHRRHRACLDLNLPVLALVEEVSDQDLFKEMDQENRKRLDLSPWEQGMMYKRALQENLFASLGELAKEVGIDKSNLSKALRLAELPDEVVKAFSSPLDLQFRWAKLLNDAIENDREPVIERAKHIRAGKFGHKSAREILDILIGVKQKEKFEENILADGVAKAKMCVDDGQVSIQFVRGVLTQAQAKELCILVQKFLNK